MKKMQHICVNIICLLAHIHSHFSCALFTKSEQTSMRRSDEESAKKPGMKRQRSFDGHEDATLPIKRKILRIDPSSAASKEPQNSPLDSDSSQQPSSADGIGLLILL
eukprot:jgi/Bigna1/81889/fgenesh1_pg.85_\